jgi:hypothetical protein
LAGAAAVSGAFFPISFAIPSLTVLKKRLSL